MNDFENNWSFQQRYQSQIEIILRRNASHLIDIRVASADDDLQHATDMTLHIIGGSVACRVRRPYPYRDLTIRAYNRGRKTELQKLREGNARWYLYLWEKTSGIIGDWILVDLDALRASDLLNNDRPIIMNRDGETGFVAYTIQELIDANALAAASV